MSIFVSWRRAGPSSDLAYLPKPTRWREPLLALTIGSLVVAAGAVRGAGPPVPDPFIVYYPGQGCDTGILEVEVWNRSKSAWQAHPHHSRILAGSCQREDAGGLLNEVRTRCDDSSLSDDPGAIQAWKVGFRLSQLRQEAECERPMPAMMSESSPHIALTVPPPDAPVRNLTRSTRISGRVELSHELVVLLDRSFDPGVARDLEEASRRMLAEREAELGSLRIAWLPFRSGATARQGSFFGDAGKEAGLSPTIPFEASATSLRASLQRTLSPGPGERPGGLVAVLMDIDQAFSADAQAQAVRRSLIAYVDSGSPLPFGARAGADPLHRRRLLDRVDSLHARGVEQQYVLVGRPERELGELVDLLRARLDASKGREGVLVIEARRAQGERSAGESTPLLGTPLSNIHVPSLERLEIINEVSGILAREVVLGARGEFSGSLPLEPGENRIRIEALLSSGVRLVSVFDRTFDYSMIKQHFLEEERDRIRRYREREGSVEIELEESGRDSPPRSQSPR